MSQSQGHLKLYPLAWIIVYDLYEEMFAVVSALDEDRIEYAVCGGIAVAIHGLVRATRDIDLLILREDLNRVLIAAHRCGFNFEGGMLPMGAGEASPPDMFRVSKVIEADPVMLDLLIANPHLQPAWEARECYEWHGRTLQAVSEAGLYVMKKLAGRPQDLVDLQRLGLWPDGPTS